MSRTDNVTDEKAARMLTPYRVQQDGNGEWIVLRYNGQAWVRAIVLDSESPPATRADD